MIPAPMGTPWWLAVGAVGAGGFLGALARFGLSGLAHKLAGTGFPYGTLAVNVTGCLVIGFVLVFAIEHGKMSDHARLLIVTGFLGSLTTFSAFGHETLVLFRDGKAALGMTNILGNVIIGLVAVAIGGLAADAVAGQPAPKQEQRDDERPRTPPAIDTLFQHGETQGPDGKVEYRVRRLPGRDGPQPAILFLHGRGESGSDNRLQLKNGLPPAVAESPEDWPFVVIAPQKLGGDKQWEDYAGEVLAILEHEIEIGRVDPERVALTGLSQGGHGVWSLAVLAPEKFSAFFSVCGYGDTYRFDGDGSLRFNQDPQSPFVARVARAVAGKPVRIRHGAEDDVVPVEQARIVAGAIESAGGAVDIEAYPGVGHDSWVRAYREVGVAEWFGSALRGSE